MSTPNPSITKAETIAELIKSGRDTEADQLIGDIVEPLTDQEIAKIFDAVYGRNEADQPISFGVGLINLVPYGLPALKFDSDPFSKYGFTRLLDATLACLARNTAEMDLSVGGNYSAEEVFLNSRALCWPFRETSKAQYVFNLLCEVPDHQTSTVLVTDAGTMLRNVVIKLTYMHGQDSRCYVTYRCDLIVRKNGTIERLGFPYTIHSEWWGGYVTD